MITRELELTFAMALREAESRRHEFVCLEHILFAMLLDARATDILRNCGADLVALKDSLDEYLSAMEALPRRVHCEPEQTVSVNRVLQRAAVHAQSAGTRRPRALQA